MNDIGSMHSNTAYLFHALYFASLLPVDSVWVSILDESVRKTLRTASDEYFSFLLKSSAAVGVGVIFELFEVLHDVTTLYRRVRRELFLQPSKPEGKRSDWLTVVATIGLLLVVGGVVGEGFSEFFISRADGQIRTFDDAVNREARQQIALAQKEGAEALENAKVAQASAAEGLAAAKQASEVAAEVANDARRAEAEESAKAQKLEKQATELEAKAVALDQRLRLRQKRYELLMQDRISLVSALKPFAGQKALVRYNPKQTVSLGLAVQQEVFFTGSNLIDIFNEAGWVCPRRLQETGDLSVEIGMLSTAGPAASKRTLDAENLLRKLLLDRQVEVSAMTTVENGGSHPGRPHDAKADDDTIIVEVGLHP